jgi:hypothetical protein
MFSLISVPDKFSASKACIKVQTNNKDLQIKLNRITEKASVKHIK